VRARKDKRITSLELLQGLASTAPKMEPRERQQENQIIEEEDDNE